MPDPDVVILRFIRTNHTVLAKRQTDGLCLIRKPRSYRYTQSVCRGLSSQTAPTSMLGARSALDKCLWNGQENKHKHASFSARYRCGIFYERKAGLPPALRCNSLLPRGPGAKPMSQSACIEARDDYFSYDSTLTR